MLKALWIEWFSKYHSFLQLLQRSFSSSVTYTGPTGTETPPKIEDGLHGRHKSQGPGQGWFGSAQRFNLRPQDVSAVLGGCWYGSSSLRNITRAIKSRVWVSQGGGEQLMVKLVKATSSIKRFVSWWVWLMMMSGLLMQVHKVECMIAAGQSQAAYGGSSDPFGLTSDGRTLLHGWTRWTFTSNRITLYEWQLLQRFWKESLLLTTAAFIWSKYSIATLISECVYS